MLLENKNAVTYGAGGAIGAAVARAFARDGAKVFLARRTLETVQAVAGDISSDGGSAEAARVNALDELAVNAIGRRTSRGRRCSTCRSTTSRTRSLPPSRRSS